MNHASTLDALAASSRIEADYRRYVGSLLEPRDPKMAVALADAVAGTKALAKGPFLEVTPPFIRGRSLAELIADGIVDPGFAQLSGPALPLARPTYSHQELALRKVLAGRNVVVSTGTGSGKTEAFLLPILNSLLAESAAGTLGPGVRALLLYPMNALANDQMKRLRALLAPTPGITFGRYVGDTEETTPAARAKFSQINPGEPQLPNELVSREQMRATPPHLLLTNYAMLEYLLLRPADLDLFEGANRDTWRFVVVDEAHVYDGAQGAEIAMLLRRLRQRVNPGRRSMQFIATSATVGNEGAEPAVMDFASRLFDAPFEWNPSDPSRQDLVVSARAKPARGTWGPLDPETWRELAAEDDPTQRILVLAKHRGQKTEDVYTALATERTVATLRAELLGRPLRATVLADIVAGNAEDPPRTLQEIVTVGSRVHDEFGSPLISARYHLWLSAIEGGFACLDPDDPHVRLTRHEQCPQCSKPMYEIAVCKRCGAVHAQGIRIRSGATEHFTPRLRDDQTPTWIVLENSQIDDEEEVDDEDRAKPESRDASFCCECGTLSEPGESTCGECSGTRLRQVALIEGKRRDLRSCRACGARGAGLVRPLSSGADATTAVLTTSLYEQLPPGPKEIRDQPGDGRRLLAFSDSRQAAAYFAPYLQTSYSRIQHRSLVLEGIKRAEDRESGPARVPDVIEHTATAADEAGFFQSRVSRQQKLRSAGTWVAAELVGTDDRQSLEGVGLIRVQFEQQPEITLPAGLLSLGLDGRERRDLLAELLRSVRLQGAMKMPKDVAADDAVFQPRLGPFFIRSEKAEMTRKVLSWVPTRGTNRRLDYLSRVLAVLAVDGVDEFDVLKAAWLALASPDSPWLVRSIHRAAGPVQQVDPDWLLLSTIPPGSDLIRCNLCRRVAPVGVRGVCPAMGCPGQLVTESTLTPEDENNHYRALYLDPTHIPLTAMEHTAQWTTEEAAAIQQRFIRGEINALSCSTTFELGVDVGDLQTVVMRNVPPTTANYVQRAGRAGRRADSAALVLTHAARRSHDQSRYAIPEEMITGSVRTPTIPLANERIDRRHAHSLVMAAFFADQWHSHGRKWNSAGDFFLPEDGSTSGPELLKSYLDSPPTHVMDALRAILPSEVAARMGLESRSWIDELLTRVDLINQEMANDITYFEQARQQAHEARNDGLAGRFGRIVATLRGRSLISVLSTKNVLPKYGFPVDVVELRTSHVEEGDGTKLQLDRDLTVAINEFAPTAQIVAGGRVWTSAGVYRLPQRELVTKHYAVCAGPAGCGRFQVGHLEGFPGECDVCGNAWKVREWIVPEFGFVADRQPTTAGTDPPNRLWNSSTYIRSMGPDVRESEVELPGRTLNIMFGTRGELTTLNEGPNGTGFLICSWCGRGLTQGAGIRAAQYKHRKIYKDEECKGYLRPQTLAHEYQTDVLAIDAGLDRSTARGTVLSLLYAILEAGSLQLQLSRDDVDGTVDISGIGQRLVLFDTVPGGAGGVTAIAEELPAVLHKALARVTDCECGEETSCYACLRSFRNQRHHELLSRWAARAMLELLMGIRP